MEIIRLRDDPRVFRRLRDDEYLVETDEVVHFHLGTEESHRPTAFSRGKKVGDARHSLGMSASFYVREIDPLIAAMVKAKTKHENQTP